MFVIIANWLVHAIALYLVAQLLSGIVLRDFGSALIAVLVIAFVNAIIKPILLLLTLPINILTLGLFTFIINALLLMLASAVTPGFEIDGFTTALIGSILLSIVTMVLNALVR